MRCSMAGEHVMAHLGSVMPCDMNATWVDPDLKVCGLIHPHGAAGAGALCGGDPRAVRDQLLCADAVCSRGAALHSNAADCPFRDAAACLIRAGTGT